MTSDAAELVLGTTHNHDAPVITYRDAETGERTALSAPELGRWAARTASLLRDGCNTRTPDGPDGPDGNGSTVGVFLPPHWQTAAVLFGAWSLGLPVAYQPWATAGLSPDGPAPVDVLFAHSKRVRSWLETMPEANHRFASDLRKVDASGFAGDALTHSANEAGPQELPDGYLDLITEARRHADTPPAYRQVGPAVTATADGTTFGALATIARSVAESRGWRRGDTIVIDSVATEEPLIWLLAPLTAGASLVICHGFADLTAVASEERATNIL